MFINFGGFLDFTKQDYAFSWEVALSSLGMPLKRIKMKKNIVVEFEDILQRKHIFRRTGGNTTIDWEKRPCSRWSIVPHLWLSFFFVRRLIWHILIWQIYMTKWYDTYWYDIWHNHFNCQTIICQFLVCLDPETSHKQKTSKHDLCCCHLSLCLSRHQPNKHSIPISAQFPS